jgi:hypothetical protein
LRPASRNCVVDHDAPLIGERTATRGHSAIGGGAEHAEWEEICSISSLAHRSTGGKLDALAASRYGA